MGFETGSDNEKIDELQKQLDDIIDSQLTSVGGNENISIDATLGARNAATGDEGGVRSSEPIIHQITDVNTLGVSTGVFDKINLISSMIIVDHTSTPMDLRFIQGPAKNGSKIKITVKKDKVLVIKSGGNILTSSDITITDTEFYILVKHSAAETGVTGGAYKILKVGTSAGAGYSIIQDEGTAVTQRSIMNFIGASVTAVDCPGNNRTDITITSGASGTLTGLTIDVAKDWQTFGITNLGKLSMVGDIDLVTQNIINIDQARFVQDSGVVTTDTDAVILVNSNDQFQFNTGEANDFIFSFSNDIGIAFVHDETVPLNPLRKLQILSDTNDTNSTGSLEIVRNFTDSASGQIIGNVLFAAPSDAGGGKVLFSSIQGEIEDATAGALDGAINFFAILNSTTVKFLGINDGGSGEVTLFRDFNVNTQNILNIDQSRYVADSGAVSADTDTVILLNSSSQFQFNIAETNDFIFSFTNDIGIAFVHDETTPTQPLRKFQILSDTTDTNSTVAIDLIRNFTTSADGQVIGQIRFAAPDDAGGDKLEFASIQGEIEDASDGSIDGAISFSASLNSSIVKFMTINNASSGNVDILRDLDINANFIQFTERAKPGNPAANDGRIYVRDNGGITTPFFLDFAGTETSLIESASIGNTIFQGNSSVTVTDTGTGFVSFLTDGTGRGTISSAGWGISNGNLTINDSSGKISFNNGFEIQNTNSTVTTFQIPNGENLLIKEGSETRIQVAKDITLNADNNDDIIFQADGTTIMTLDSSANELIIQNNAEIQINSGSFINFISSGSPTSGAELGKVQIKIGGVLRSIPFFAA